MLTSVTSVPLRSPTVMLSAPPRARKSMDSMPSRSIVTLATSRVNSGASAVGGDVDVLVDVGAEEGQRVGAGLALDRVVAVAWIPLELVVTGAQVGNVVAVVAEDEVVAVAAEEHVGALAAEQAVVAGAAIERELDDARRKRRRRDLSLPPRPCTVSRSSAPSELVTLTCADSPRTGHARARADDVDDVVAAGAADSDVIRLGIARRAADRAGEVDVHLASRRCR